jgi:hypothetical protein
MDSPTAAGWPHLYVLCDWYPQFDAVPVKVPAHHQLPKLLVEGPQIADEGTGNSTVACKPLDLGIKLFALLGPAALLTCENSRAQQT